MAYRGNASAGQYYSSSAVHASSYHSASHGVQLQAAVPATSDEDEFADRADAAAPIAGGSGLYSDGLHSDGLHNNDVNLEMQGEL